MRLTPILLFLAFVGTAFAQAPVVRLSPLEATTRALAGDVAIQAADSHANRTYVVWGTYGEISGREGTRMLVMSVASTGEVATQPRAVHGVAGRPSRLVRVVATDEGATVLWFDRRRDAPGLYARRFTRDGMPLEQESRVVPGDIEDIVTEPLHPVMTLVLPYGEYAATLHPNGDAFATAGRSPLAAPHVLREDSSLVSLLGTRLELRRLYWAPARTSILDILGLGSYFPGAWTIALDSTGATRLFFLEQDTVASPTCFGETWAGLRLRSGLVGADGRVEAISTVDTFSTCNGGLAAVSARIRQARRWRVGGGFGLAIELERVRRTLAGGLDTLVDTVEAGIGPRGEYIRRRPRSGEWNGGRVEVSRGRSDTLSVVRAVASGVELVAPIAAAPSGSSQTAPGLFTGPADLVAWSEPDGRHRRIVLLRRDVGGFSLQPIDTVELLDSSWQRHGVPSSIEGERTGLWTGGSLRPIAADLEWQWAYSSATGNGATFSTAVAWAPDERGWRRILGRSHTGPRTTRGAEYAVTAIGAGLDRSAVILLEDRTGRSDIRLDGRTDAIDSGRTTQRPPSPMVASIDRTHWALINGDTLRIADPDMIGTRFVVPPTHARETRWHKLSDGTLVRATLDGDSALVKLLTLDRTGTIRSQGSVSVPRGARSIEVIPTDDSTIGLLFESPRGIELARFPASFEPSTVALVVGERYDSLAHIVGRISRGELFVAWEEEREGTADVFGARVPVGPTGGALDPVKDPRRPQRMYIGATEGRVEVLLAASHHAALARLFDARGELIRSFSVEPDTGERRLAIDSRSLASGIYHLLVVEPGRHSSSYVITVSH